MYNWNNSCIFAPQNNTKYEIRFHHRRRALLSREKARLQQRPHHASWLRIYAIRLEKGIYIVTGGAIKLTRTMQEREHTLLELQKMEQVRKFLLENGIIDEDSFIEFIND